MSSFMQDLAKAIGYHWHEGRMSSSQEYRRKDLSIDKQTKKFLNKIEQQYTQLEPRSNKTYAKILHDLNHPDWIWLTKTVPKDVLDRIKEKSGIVDEPEKKPDAVDNPEQAKQ